MYKLFLNLDNSFFSKLFIYLMEDVTSVQAITDISNFTGISYPTTKIIINKMYKFGMLKRYVRGGQSFYCINPESDIANAFLKYCKYVIKYQENFKKK